MLRERKTQVPVFNIFFGGGTKNAIGSLSNVFVSVNPLYLVKTELLKVSQGFSRVFG